jgi:hypothetical protein
VPDNRRPHAAIVRLLRQLRDMPPSGVRQRTPRIDIGSDRVSVMD